MGSGQGTLPVEHDLRGTGAPLPGDRPAPERVRIRIEEVLVVWGQVCVVVGQVESGTVRPPVQVAVAPTPGSGPDRLVVMIVQAMMRRKAQSEVPTGAKAGFTLQGIPGGAGQARSFLHKGDVLETP